MIELPPLWMVFDVESIGLHGEAFAWGAVVIDGLGRELLARREVCFPEVAGGTPEGHSWVKKHVPKMTFTASATIDIRERFWKMWLVQKEKGTLLAADIAWPVEARFLAACIDDSPDDRCWEGPFPLVDISSVCLAAQSPYKTDRLPNELPEHDPLADARQSARLLIEALARIQDRR